MKDGTKVKDTSANATRLDDNKGFIYKKEKFNKHHPRPLSRCRELRLSFIFKHKIAKLQIYLPLYFEAPTGNT
jgi:hypothetical protein